MKKTLFTIACTFLLSSAFVQAESTDKADVKKPDPAAKFAELDLNKDGSLDKDEFVKGRKNAEKAAKYFAKMDKDSDGKITLEEFTAPRPPKAPKADKPAAG